jgi:hypothetical protein
VRQPKPPELGQVLSRHNGRILAGGWLLYLGAIFAASAVYWLIAANWAWAAGCAAVVAVALFISWRRWNQSATVHEHGIVWQRGRRRKVVRWQEVANVVAESIDDEFMITVTTHDGRELVLDDYLADVQQLHGYLLNATGGRGRDSTAPSLTSSSFRWPR